MIKIQTRFVQLKIRIYHLVSDFGIRALNLTKKWGLDIAAECRSHTLSGIRIESPISRKNIYFFVRYLSLISGA